MARLRTHDEYTNLGIRVDGYDVAVGKSLNLNLIGNFRTYLDDDEPVFPSGIRFELSGTCISPRERAKEKYEITIYGEQVERTELKVKDIRLRDKRDLPIYRRRGDRQIPVYNPPTGFATLQRNAALSTWQACLWITFSSATNMLVLLAKLGGRQIYVSVDERRHDRKRWIRSFSLQTRNPMDE